MKNSKKVQKEPPKPGLPTKAIGPLFFLWSTVVFWLYASHSSASPSAVLWILDQVPEFHLFHPYMLKVLAGIAVALWLVWLAFQIGHWIVVRVLGGLTLDPEENIVLASSTGLGALALFITLMGAVGAWRSVCLWGTLGIVTLYFIFLAHSQEWFAQPNQPTEQVPWKPLWNIVLILFFFLFLIEQLSPEVFYDSLYYHIAVPNVYRLTHHLMSLPSLLFSNFAMTLQMVYGLALTLGNTLSAKLIHGCTGVLVLISFLAFGRRFFSPGTGWLAGVLFISMPLVGINVVETGVDVGWSFLQIASAYALIRALQQDETRWMILAGLLTGLSASCKYPGFPYIPIALAVIAWTRLADQHKPLPVVIRELFRFSAASSVMILPILIRNVAFHGNPLYPFGGTSFGHPRIDPHYWQIFLTDANTRHITEIFSSWEAASRFFLHPWFLTMSGNSNSDFIGPLYLIFLPLLFIFRAPSEPYRILRRYTALLWLLWMVTSTSPRYGLPALAMASLLLGECVIAGFRGSRWRAWALTTLAAGSAINLISVLIVTFYFGGWRVLGGLQTEDAYLSEMHGGYPTPPYAGILWMNQNLPANAKVVFAGEARSYYMNREVIPSSVPDPQPLLTFSRESHTGQDMARQMREQKITHIYLNLQEAVRTEGYGLFPFDKPSWKTFDDFWNHYIKLVWKIENPSRENPQNQYVYEIASDADALVPHQAPPNPFSRWAPK